MTARLARTAQPAVFDLEEAVGYIADVLPEENAGRLTHDDVRWILRTDVDLLEEASDDEVEPTPHRGRRRGHAVARILHRAERDDRDLLDEDVVAVLDARSGYLEAIGAIGPRPRARSIPVRRSSGTRRATSWATSRPRRLTRLADRVRPRFRHPSPKLGLRSGGYVV